MSRHAHVQKSTGTWRRRAVRTCAAVGLVLGASAVPALTGQATAAGPLPTTTTVSASPATSVSGAAVTLTAKVSVLNLPIGLIVTPTGTVTFSFVQSGTTFPIATVPVASCPLSACTATTTTTKLRAGTSSVVASYSGDTAAAASTGSTAVTVTSANDGALQSTTCAPNVPCTTTASATSGTTSVTVTSTSAMMQTVYAQAVGGQLHCPGNVDPAAGVAMFFDNTANDAGKTVTYVTAGAAGQQTIANYTAHPTYLGCYAAPTPFLGYTSGVYGPATLVAEDGGASYEAQLARCDTNGNVKPCFTFSVSYPDGRCPPSSNNPNGAPPNCGNGKNAVAPDKAIVTIYTPVGDPKFTG